MSEFFNSMTKTKKDLAVFHAVVKAGIEPTTSVVVGLWHWFSNVDIAIPLPIMPLEEDERQSIALNVLEEMQVVADRLEVAIEKLLSDPEDRHEYFANSPDVATFDSLWRELASLYAHIINPQVRVMTEEEQEMVSESFIESAMNDFHIPRDEVIEQIKLDPSLKMRLRLLGVNPDRIK